MTKLSFSTTTYLKFQTKRILRYLSSSQTSYISHTTNPKSTDCQLNNRSKLHSKFSQINLQYTISNVNEIQTHFHDENGTSPCIYYIQNSFVEDRTTLYNEKETFSVRSHHFARFRNGLAVNRDRINPRFLFYCNGDRRSRSRGTFPLPVRLEKTCLPNLLDGRIARIPRRRGNREPWTRFLRCVRAPHSSGVQITRAPCRDKAVPHYGRLCNVRLFV